MLNHRSLSYLLIKTSSIKVQKFLHIQYTVELSIIFLQHIASLLVLTGVKNKCMHSKIPVINVPISQVLPLHIFFPSHIFSPLSLPVAEESLGSGQMYFVKVASWSPGLQAWVWLSWTGAVLLWQKTRIEQGMEQGETEGGEETLEERNGYEGKETLIMREGKAGRTYCMWFKLLLRRAPFVCHVYF